ncbi:flagellar hook-length control protein FliK [Candidatus Liberibacter brunswickensis]|uniref:flagellar hook-length control protein FliK n=1 Tax=Candidatus Liberibacter brunswickensis TaxID=1968796 RepID=UPI002FE0C317
MKEVNNIPYKNTFDNKNNHLDYTQGKKKNNNIKNIDKNSDKQDFDFQNQSLFKQVLLTIPNTESHIDGKEGVLIDNYLTNTSVEKSLCSIVSQYLILRDTIVDNKDISSIESYSNSTQDIEQILSVLPQKFSILSDKKKYKSSLNTPMTMKFDLSQLKSNTSENNNYVGNEQENLSGKELFTEVDFLTENPFDVLSSDEKMINLECFLGQNKYYYGDRFDSFKYLENIINKTSFMRFPMIPESITYTDRGSIKTLKIHIKPNSPDSVIATLCLSGDNLSVKLQVDSDHIYKKIQTGRQDILDSLNFSGYKIDCFDVDFTRKDSSEISQDSMNYFSQQQGSMQSNNFDRKKSDSFIKERVGKKMLWKEKISNPIYSNGDIIGIYSNYIYV